MPEEGEGVQLYDTGTWEKLARLDGERFLAASPDGKILLTTGTAKEPSLTAWDIASGARLKRLSQELIPADTSPLGQSPTALFSPDGNWVVFVQGESALVIRATYL